MPRYVNQHAIGEAFQEVDAELNPVARAEMLTTIQQDFLNRLINHYERLAYELKTQGWVTGQIADLTGFSERRIKKMLRDYSERTGVWNPLMHRSGEGAIDISHLVTRVRAAKEEPHPHQTQDDSTMTTHPHGETTS